jgi:HEAT repeat protein
MAREDQAEARLSRAGAAAVYESQAQRLVHLAWERGEEAIPLLVNALEHADPWVRLHAAQGLAAIDHPAARAGLVTALHDDNFGVHWAAARALAAAARSGALSVLQALVHDLPSTGFLHGAAYVLHHVQLSAQERQTVQPVADALHRPAADLEAPLAAFTALEQLGAADAPAAGPPARRYLAGQRKRSRLERLTPAAVTGGEV